MSETDPKSTNPNTAAPNRRKAERRYYKTTIFLHKGEHGLGQVITGQLLNVSTTGVAVLARGEFEPREELYLALLDPRRETITEVRGTIQWIREEAAGVVRCGIWFHKNLTNEQVARIA
jgi:hypothetical protein